MKIWITKNSEIPVRTQIVSQVQVAIASGDLRPGDRLPSTRELARRCGIHANTVSAAYRELEISGSVELRKGSGIYIRDKGLDRLDTLLERLFREASEAGFSRDAVIERLSFRERNEGTNRFVLFEPNDDLAEIIAYEIYDATGIKTVEWEAGAPKPGDVLVALFDEAPKVRDAFGNVDCIILSPNSVANSLSGRTPPQRDELVAVVSAWDDFLTLARIFLLAAGVEEESIFTCSSREAEWERRLGAAAMIICDSVTAIRFPDDERIVAFRLISNVSLDELKTRAKFHTVAPAISIPND